MKFRVSSATGAIRAARAKSKQRADNLLETSRGLRTDETNTIVFDLNELGLKPVSFTPLEELKINLGSLTENELQKTIADLIHHGTGAAIPLIENLSHHASVKIRKSVASSLNEFDYLEIIDTLLNLLMDRSPEVREEATTSLGRFAMTDTLPLLRRMSRDKSERVRFATLKALSNFEVSAPAEVLSVSSPLLLDPKPANAVTAFQVIKNLEFTTVSEQAQALINGVETFHPTLAAASSASAPAIIASFPAPGIDMWCERNWRTLENRPETGETQVAELTAVIKTEDEKVNRKGPRHLNGWWAGMLHHNDFKPGEPQFISSRPGYTYRFCAAITGGDLPGDYVAHAPIELGEGATVVAVALIVDNEYLAIEGDGVKELQVPAEGDSNVAEFLIRGLKPGDTGLELLVYHRGCLTVRAVTTQIAVKNVDGSVTDKVVPVATPVMSKGDDVTTAAGAIVQQRLASLMIAPPMFNPRDELVFALFSQDDTGYHFETTRVPKERANVNRNFLREGLSKLIGQRRDLWRGYQKVFLQDSFDLKISKRDSQKGLQTLKEVGLRLWSDIFQGPGLESIRRRLQNLLEGARESSVLQIVSDKVFLPWQLVYLNDGQAQPSIDRFWGMRFQTEQTLALGLSLAVTAPQKASGPIAAYFNSNLPGQTIEMHKKIIRKYRDKESELLSDLKLVDNRSPALYFYCHAEYNPQDKQKSWIELTNVNARLTLGHLQDETRVDPATQSQIEFKSAPLVFLNACQSGEMDSAIYESFVGFMLRDKKAGGVVGTETRMPAFFATNLAVEFWERAKSNPSPVSKILFDLRRDYWKNYNNPLGFLYSLYTNGDFTVAVN
ncbi:MAG: HEAT repeat domain-containing protein [Acidobacteriota bacterium]|nr:HEAT repeat domain-containing protein [Acidobacteriota bacterium]